MTNKSATTAPRFELPTAPALPDAIECLLIASWRSRNYDAIVSMVNIATGGTGLKLVWTDPLMDEGETEE